MKKKALRKDFHMEIKKSLNRFFSIFLIVALGVAFFSGIRATQPDMQMSADAFYDQSKLMDIRVLGDLGMTEDDKEAISELEGVKHVMASHSQDVLCDTESSQLVLKLMSVPDELNLITIQEGRLPEASGECLADREFIETTGYQIGDSFTVKSGTEDETEDLLNRDTYTIVGIGSTSYYLSFDRGSSSIGSGDVNSFIIIMPEDFAAEVYSELYVSVKGADALLSYSDEYDALVEEVTDRIEAIADARCEIRYQDVVTEANDKIADGEQEIKDGEKKVTDAEQELADAKQELDDGKKKIDDGEAELEDGKKKLAEHEQDVIDGEQELKDAEQDLIDGKKELEDGRAELDKNWLKLADGREEVMRNKQKLKDGELELEEGKKTLAEKEEQLNAGEQQLQTQEQALNDLKSGLEQAGQTGEDQQGWDARKAAACGVASYLNQAGITKEQLEAQGINAGLAAIMVDANMIGHLPYGVASEQAIIRGLLQADTGVVVSGLKTVEAKKPEIAAGREEIGKAKQTIAEKEVEIGMAWDKIHQAEYDIIYGEQDLVEAEQEWEDGRQEYEDGLQEYEDGKKELEDGKAAISDYINFRDRVTHEPYTMDDEGVIITEKLASLLDVQVGDMITLKEDDSSDIQVKVSAVTENYFMHYVYMSPVLYEQLFGKTIVYSQIFLNNRQNDEAFETAMGTDYMEMDSVAGITFYSGMADRIRDMLKSMDTVIWVLVVSAALLAFVVLYNLNNINVNERKRELATLKVLGFYDGEVSSYVNRENVILTFLGAAVGVFMGLVMHHFVIITAEIDIMMFGRNIHFISYVYSILLTFAFSVIVNFAMFFRLRKIDMIESLKSVE